MATPGSPLADGVSRRGLFTGLRRRLTPGEDPPLTAGADGEDHEEVRDRLAAAWQGSDGRLWAQTAELLLEMAPPVAGERVLDAGCGDGNVALQLAEQGAVVTACDLSETLLDAARRRAAVAGVEIDWREADLEALPFADASFDASCSALAPPFCARPHRALAELVRVTRPGGHIALALWTRAGAVGRLLRLAAIADPPPGGGRGPVAWGARDRLGDGLGDAGAQLLGTEQATVRMGFASRDEAVERLCAVLGPLAGALARLPAEEVRTLRSAVERAVAAEATTRGERTMLTGEVLLAVAQRPAR